MSKGEQAKHLFMSGLNCSQSVAIAFCDEMNMDSETVKKLVIGFGGGMGRLREVCGAVSGMVFVLSALYGDKGRAEVYSMVQTVAKEYEKANGSIVCRELLGMAPKQIDSPVPEERTKEYYKKRPCAELCRIAADILENFINTYNNG